MDPSTLARLLRRTGFFLSLAWLGLFAVFLAGEALADPGGWRGIALVLAWATPLTLAVVLARYRPAAATRVFTALAGAVVAGNLWFAADPTGWRSVENHHGPLRAVVVFVVASGLVVLGLRRTMTAGCLLLVVCGVPMAVASVRSGGFASMVAAAFIPTVTGVLYVAAGLGEDRERRRRRTNDQNASTRPDGVRRSRSRSEVDVLTRLVK